MPLDWSDAGVAARMAKGWGGGLADGTPCGSGSTLEATSRIRDSLPALCLRRRFLTLSDAGAGDMHWQRLIPWPHYAVVYRPFDLVARVAGVVQWDFLARDLPDCDVILCRHVLIHLDPTRIAAALEGFARSAPYLIASQYDDGGEFDARLQCNRTDLRPLLGEPLERLPDASGDLCLWRLA